MANITPAPKPPTILFSVSLTITTHVMVTPAVTRKNQPAIVINLKIMSITLPLPSRNPVRDAAHYRPDSTSLLRQTGFALCL